MLICFVKKNDLYFLLLSFYVGQLSSGKFLSTKNECTFIVISEQNGSEKRRSTAPNFLTIVMTALNQLFI